MEKWGNLTTHLRNSENQMVIALALASFAAGILGVKAYERSQSKRKNISATHPRNHASLDGRVEDVNKPKTRLSNKMDNPNVTKRHRAPQIANDENDEENEINELNETEK
eukprot:3934380-Rhodomonas_salina.1